MSHKFVQLSLFVVLGFSTSSFAQLNVQKDAPANGTAGTAFKIATINMQQTIFASNEGRRISTRSR